MDGVELLTSNSLVSVTWIQATVREQLSDETYANAINLIWMDSMQAIVKNAIKERIHNV
jgi:hypothetical protein